MHCVTADLVDDYASVVSSCDVQFRQFGGRTSFCGPIRTIRTLEDNALIRTILSSLARNSVLVVDGGGSLRAALIGDQIAALAVTNGWAGLIIFGAIRDALALKELPIGIKALGTNPWKSAKAATGSIDVPVDFGGVQFRPGEWVYSDDDGILTSAERLLLPEPHS